MCVDIGRKRYRRNKFIDLIARNTIAERQLIARAAIKKASTLAYLPCHADIDLKLLDLIHIAYTDGIQKSDLYRYDSQTFNIIISGETGELLCKYDES